jgi:hypothetical protein
MELSHSEIIEIMKNCREGFKDLIIVREYHVNDNDKWAIPLKMDVVYSTHPNYKSNDIIYKGENARAGRPIRDPNESYVEAIYRLVTGPVSQGYKVLNVVETGGHINWIQEFSVFPKH